MNGPWLLIAVIILGLAFDFTNGFHDTANLIATPLATRALSPSGAIMLSCALNFAGALSFTGVAQTVGGKITDPFKLPNGPVIVAAALAAAITWNLFTWYLGLPSSSSHALVGALAGAVLAGPGFGDINYNGFLSVVQGLALSPVLAFPAGLLIMALIKVLLGKAPLHPTNRRFRTLQVFSAAAQSFAHGTNDAQKTMGVITLALVSGGYLHALLVPFWVKLLAAAGMAAGTGSGGWRIIKTVGTGIIRLEPASGFSADLGSAAVILSATFFRLPVSSTQVISASILGVGTARRRSMVRWGTMVNIAAAWLATLPAAAFLAEGYYRLLTAPGVIR